MSKAICADCRVPLEPGVVTRYCGACNAIRSEYSRICTECQTNLIPLEADDFCELCTECSAPKYPCSTPGCLLTTTEKWKSLCANCYNKPKRSTRRDLLSDDGTTPTRSPAGMPACTKCGEAVSLSWQKVCDACFVPDRSKAATPKTTPVKRGQVEAGEVKCSSPSCETFIPNTYRKYCNPCFSKLAPRTPIKTATSEGAYKCVTPGCENRFPEKWKKTCLTCYRAAS